MSAKLIAPMIDKDFASGFDYVVETLRSNGSNDLANELEISKALSFMKNKDVNKVQEGLEFCRTALIKILFKAIPSFLDS